MTTIQQEDFISSIAEALQFISYYHPIDFIQAMGEAWQREESPAAKDAIAQILMNSRMSALGKRPICQDTGIVVIFLKIGMEVRWESTLSIQEMADEGVRRAYLHPDNKLRASVLSDPAGKRSNTRDNTPAVVHMEVVPGSHLQVTVAAKGGGSENKSRFANLSPSANVADWVVEQLPTMGAGWCPPGMLGVGIGGTAEKAMLMAKESLMEPINIHTLRESGPRCRADELRLEIMERANALGIGAQGLGGLTTLLDVKIKEYPTHAASLPVAIIPNCAATRHLHFSLDGSGPAQLPPPSIDQWPDVEWQPAADARKVNLDQLTAEETQAWRPGDTLLLSGKLLTGRDAAHKRIADLYAAGEALPEGVDLTNRMIYYVGPVDPVGDEVVGPAGPTTSTRMDSFTELMLEKTGLIGMVGKAERGPATIESIKKHRSVYLIAVGGAAYLVAKAIKKSRIVAFEELGMEAIYEFEVEEMPVTVAVDSLGDSIHKSGPAAWKTEIESHS
ncbi:MAG: fumarate hydratase [Gammaproteobacteria bacterium]|jgi:fumarate hydratase class I|nr:fumarate hydratase [Gammaproteobacteria bacterium]MBT3489346.1 fumarate hydratase [Gammaproteobacteria bacterium]MBT3718702.1 fumarate hydratase [Gammaproteobacteria bacterium]MBT3844653.1 fumarate hydratase [Gammaproteobacteria bacterium]MBT3893323.1 fumarate hydratase [Gammaproteobacteria bacterium]